METGGSGRGPGRRQLIGVAALGAAAGAGAVPAFHALVPAASGAPSTAPPTSADATTAPPGGAQTTSTQTTSTETTGDQTAAGDRPATVDPTGPHQAGVAHPLPAPDHLTLAVADLRPGVRLDTLLAGLGELTRRLAAGDHPALAGLAPRRLTVTVGLGPRVVAAIDRALPGATDLPRFAREQHLAERDRGGDLAVQVAADEPVVLGLALSALTSQLSGQVTPRWSQTGFRGPAQGPAARNVIGFTDGIAVPRTQEELDDTVWRPASEARVGGGTVMVVRRLRVDTTRFARLTLTEQERVIGRRRDTGAPLSGGTGTDGIDLRAKTPDGQYVVPALAHARRAHPLTVGAGLMMRRSYSTADATAGPGLLFISYQRELRSFVVTQTQMDAGDALMAFATPTAGATFLVLPGFTTARPLGAALFA